jgi:hypothetical protein
MIVGMASAGAAKSSGPTPDPAFRGKGGQRAAGAVAELGNGWVAAGSEQDDNHYSEAAFWVASKIDGGWQRIGDNNIGGAIAGGLGPDSSGLAIDSVAHGISVGTARIVAAGSATYFQASANGQTTQTGPLPAVWISDDGSSWQSSLLPMPDGGKVAVAESVASRDGEYVVVGTVSADDHIGGTGDLPIAWYSTDGVTWTLGRGMIGSVSGETKAYGVTAADTGSSPLFVAVGGSVTNSSNDAAVWTSDDGIAWTKVANSTALGQGNKISDQEMLAIAALGSGAGFIAVGDESANSSSTSRGVVWRSSDGATWTRTAANDSTFVSKDKANPSVILSSVAIGAGYYVTVGSAQSDKSSSSRAVGWTSTDAKKWTTLTAGDGSTKVQSAMLSVDANGKNYEIVGVLRSDANNWNGKK